MRIIRLDDKYSVVCNSVSTRNGFRHDAVLMENGVEVAKAKVNYLNRTWEAHEFDTVITRVILKYFKGDELNKYRMRRR